MRVVRRNIKGNADALQTYKEYCRKEFPATHKIEFHQDGSVGYRISRFNFNMYFVGRTEEDAVLEATEWVLQNAEKVLKEI